MYFTQMHLAHTDQQVHHMDTVPQIRIVSTNPSHKSRLDDIDPSLHDDSKYGLMLVLKVCHDVKAVSVSVDQLWSCRR